MDLFKYILYLELTLWKFTLMTSQGSETVTVMFWQNGITVITRAR